MADKKREKKEDAPKEDKPAAKAKLSNVTLTVKAFQAQGKREVSTNVGPRFAMPGEWILDMTEGQYVIATDEQVQRLLKK